MRRAFVVVLLTLAAPGALAAQERHFGIGLPVVDWTNGVLFPIRLLRTWRLEPEVALSTQHQSGSSGTATTRSYYTSVTAGVGLLRVLAGRGSTRPYVGVRLGAIRNLQRSDTIDPVFGSSSLTSRQTTLYARGVLGGEYYFSPNFSLGGEVRLNYSRNGKPAGSYPSGNAKGYAISTLGVALVRVYF